MKFSENRIIAWIVLAGCVLLSIFGFGGMGLSREYNKAIEIFNEGTDKSLSVRHSIDSYLDASVDAALIMASEAELHMGDSSLSEQTRELVSVIGETADIGDRYSGYTALKENIEKLYNAVYNAIDESAFKDFKLAYDDFWGYENMIRLDGYHRIAADYNDMAEGFPGRPVAGIYGIDELNTFGG